MRRIAAVCLSMICLLVLSLNTMSAQETVSDQPAWVKGIGGLWQVKHTPDNSRIVLATTTGLYLIDTGKPDAPPVKLEGHSDNIRNIIFTPDSTLMATSSFDGTVRLWRMPTGEAIWSARISEPCCPGEPPSQLYFTDDASLLMVTTGLQYPAGAFVVNVLSGKVQRIENNMFPFNATVRGNDVFYLNQQQGGFKVYRLHATDEDITLTDVAQLNDAQVSEKSTGNSTAIFTQDYAAATSDNGVLSSVNLNDASQSKSLPDFPRLMGSFENTVWGSTTTKIYAANLATGERVDFPSSDLLGINEGQWIAYRDAEDIQVLDLKTLKDMPFAPLPVPRLYSWNSGVLVYEQDKQLYLFNAAVGKTVTLEGAVIADPDNTQSLYTNVREDKIVVSYGYSPGYIGIWDTMTGASIVPATQYGSLSTNNVVGNGSRLALSAQEASGQDFGILIVDIEAGQFHFYNPQVRGYLQDFFGDKLFLGGTTPTLVDITTREEKPLALDSFSTPDLAFSPDSKLLATNGSGNTIRLLDANTGAQTAVIALPQNLRRMAYGEHGIAALYENSQVQFFKVPPTGAPSHPTDGATNLYDVDIAGDLVAAAGEGDVQLFGLDTDGQLTAQTTLVPEASLTEIRQYEAVAIGSRYIAASGSVYAADGTFDTVVDLWSATTRKFVRRLDTLRGSYVYNLSFTPDSSYMVLTESGVTIVWNLTRTLDEPLYLTSMGFDSGHAIIGNELAVVEQSWLTHTIDLRRISDGSSVGTLKRSLNSDGGGGGDGYRVPIATSPDGTHLAMVDASGELVVWNVPQIQDDPTDEADVFAYCDSLKDASVTPSQNQSVNLMWSWYATTVPLTFEHIYRSHYEIKLDGGVVLPEWQMTRSVVQRDPANSNHWTVYYKINVGKLSPGTHTVSYRVTWQSKISDGITAYGPDTNHPEDTGSCTFTVK